MGSRSGGDIALLVVVPLLGLLTLPEVFTANSAPERVVAALVVVGCAIYVGVDVRRARTMADKITAVTQQPTGKASEDTSTTQDAQPRKHSVPVILGVAIFLAVVVAGIWVQVQLEVELLSLLIVGGLIAHQSRARTIR